MNVKLLNTLRETDALLRDNGLPLFLTAVGPEGVAARLSPDRPADPERILGVIPSVSPSSLGSRDFQKTFGLSLSYTSGAMAGGIASTALVSAACKAGGIGFFGAGGLPPEKISLSMDELKRSLGGKVFGCNLLHSPTEPEMDMAAVQACLDKEVRAVEAAAFLRVTDAIVVFRSKGLKLLPDGTIAQKNHVFAKISRPEVADQFLRPAPESILRSLTEAGKITEQEAVLASRLPVVTAITAEADSGGHTDQRPFSVLLPLVLDVRERARQTYGWSEETIPIFVGAAGGIGDPQAIWAALAAGADFISTGSLNQSCLEAGTSAVVKESLCRAGMADVAMAPSADLFEMGGRVQVLKRGTMFAQRAQKLLDAWKSADSFENLSESDRCKIEQDILRAPFQSVWEETRDYWLSRNPRVIERALTDGKVRMALTFRAYLGLSSRWARQGNTERKSDFQIWCGPAIGAFNKWVEGSWLQDASSRSFPLVLSAMMRSSASLVRRSVLQALGATNLPSVRSIARPCLREEL